MENLETRQGYREEERASRRVDKIEKSTRERIMGYNILL